VQLDLAGKVALITGAGSGIGATISHHLAREGMRVAVCDINQEAAERTVESLRRDGHDACALQADVTDEESVARMLESLIANFGAIHALVNNAGFTRDMRIVKMQLQDWDSVVDVILKGAFLCTRAVIPHLIEQGWGRVINISSRGHFGNPGQCNYAAAKAGLIGFTRALAKENGRHGITVNAIAPGIIDTQAVRSLPHYEKIRDAAEKATPIPRIGQTDDVADAVTFFVSNRASYITGEVLHVTGGRYG
jgi:3-oxoacyl-[acyl-carrier protein] reductase